MKHEIKNNILTRVLSRAQIQIYKLNFPGSLNTINPASSDLVGGGPGSGELTVIGLMYRHLQTVLYLCDLQLLSLILFCISYLCILSLTFIFGQNNQIKSLEGLFE